MEIRQLEYFVAVVEDGNFTRAAARVHVTQPGVSAQIRRLERELGYELLDRSGRTVRPTAVGEALLPYARAALAAVRDARLAVDQVAGLLRGQVNVGMVTVVASLDVPDMLARFQAAHPAVEVSLRQGSTDDLVEALRDGELHMAFLGMAVEPPAFLRTAVVRADPLVAVLRADDEYGGRESLFLKELAARQLITLPSESGTRRLLDLSLVAAGVDTPIAFSASDPQVLVDMAARGFGVAILPRGAVRSPGDEVRLVPFRDPDLHGRIYLAWPDDRTIDPAAQAVIQHALDRIQDGDEVLPEADAPPGTGGAPGTSGPPGGTSGPPGTSRASGTDGPDSA
ncbi:LysR family transcriptional regulator [Streptomyces sp. NPDC002564]|uniref:LysR family transcriptional regulator n=1 Tax=Streptomyces sp. NPDC002564 TaxID=3364649 RepID=UPI003695CCE4